MSTDLAADARWPLFRAEAVAQGFLAVQAFPLRLRDVVIGTLNIFMNHPSDFDAEDLRICQALADVATIAILQSEAVSKAQKINAQLQAALDSRIVIEQAKGVLGERARVDMDEAFSMLRHFARDNNRQLSQVAAAVVAGTLSATELRFAER